MEKQNGQAEMSQRIMGMLESGLKAKEIARLLKADDYLETRANRSRKIETAVVFKVQDFVRDHVRRFGYIKFPETSQALPNVILPPTKGAVNITGNGEGDFEKRDFPRIMKMMEVLTELNCEYKLIIGKNSAKMMRATSYHIFVIPNLQKIAFVCDEEGNASFVIHEVENETNWKDFYDFQKDELRDLGSNKVDVIIYPGDICEWQNLMRTVLLKENPINEISDSVSEAVNETSFNDWLTIDELKTILKRGRDTTRKYLTEFRTSNPEWIKKNKGFTIVHPELVEILKQKCKSCPPPEGWLTLGELASEVNLNTSSTIITRLIKYFNKSIPNSIATFNHPKNHRKYKYHSPKLVQAIVNEINKTKPPKKEWQHILGLSIKFNYSRNGISKLIDDYRQNHPLWFGNFKHPRSGQTLEYFSPKLVSELQKHFDSLKEAPEDWKRLPEVQIMFDIPRKALERIVNKYRESNPEYFCSYWFPKFGRTELFMSPEMIEIFRKEFEGVEIAPKGWENPTSLMDRFKRGRDAVHKIAEKFRETHPKKFRKFKHPESGVLMEFYSPELVKIITEDLNSLTTAPEGWLTLAQILRKLNKSTDRSVSKLVKKLSTEYEDCPSKYIGCQNRLQKFYSPELVLRVINEFSQIEGINL